MSERTTTKKNGATTAGAGTSTADSVPGAPGTAAKTDTGPIAVAPDTPAAAPSAGEPTPSEGAPSAGVPSAGVPSGGSPSEPPATDGAGADRSPGVHVTKPVTVRPKVRGPRRGPLTRMGPWAPVAGALAGLLAGVLVVLLLVGAAEDFADRLALVLTVVGLGMLGAAGTLLADEVRMIRQGARDAAVRPAWVEATAPLLRGLTPARLLLLVSAFVLFLAAYVTR